MFVVAVMAVKKTSGDGWIVKISQTKLDFGMLEWLGCRLNMYLGKFEKASIGISMAGKMGGRQ